MWREEDDELHFFIEGLKKKKRDTAIFVAVLSLCLIALAIGGVRMIKLGNWVGVICAAVMVVLISIVLWVATMNLIRTSQLIDELRIQEALHGKVNIIDERNELDL